jgi:hypothetical protein
VKLVVKSHTKTRTSPLCVCTSASRVVHTPCDVDNHACDVDNRATDPFNVGGGRVKFMLSDHFDNAARATSGDDTRPPATRVLNEAAERMQKKHRIGAPETKLAVVTVFLSCLQRMLSSRVIRTRRTLWRGSSAPVRPSTPPRY